MSVSLRKALTKEECAVKSKHIKTILSETHSEKSEKRFWSFAEKLPLHRQNIIAWKFCHILHRILTDGHPNALNYAKQKRGLLIDLGNSWNLTQLNYANEIQLYTSLLETKLLFHAMFPQLPGNLVISTGDLEKLGGSQISLFGELAILVSDYLQRIYDLRASIFKSLKRSKNTSMMAAGQCRLEPIALCFKDALRLHEIMGKILQISPSCLPVKMTNYRERYENQISNFRKSYDKAMKYQFVTETMPAEVKLTISSQEFGHSTESDMDTFLEESEQKKNSEDTNVKIIKETISGLEVLNQQFSTTLSKAKHNLQKNDSTGNDESSPPTQITSNDDEIIEKFEKRFDDFLDRYFTNKMQTVKLDENDERVDDKVEKREERSTEKYSSPSLEQLAHKLIDLLTLLTRPEKSQATSMTNIFETTSMLGEHLRDFEQVIIWQNGSPSPKRPTYFEKLDGNDKDSDEYITILSQRLQFLLDRLYTDQYRYQYSDEGSYQLDSENNASTKSVQTESSEEDAVTDDFLLVQKITLKQILDEVLKLQDMLKNPKPV